MVAYVSPAWFQFLGGVDLYPNVWLLMYHLRAFNFSEGWIYILMSILYAPASIHNITSNRMVSILRKAKQTLFNSSFEKIFFVLSDGLESTLTFNNLLSADSVLKSFLMQTRFKINGQCFNSLCPQFNCSDRSSYSDSVIQYISSKEFLLRF